MRVILCFVAQLLWVGVVSAEDEYYVVKYSQQELQNADGMRQVLQRIETSAKRYCPTYLEIRSHADVQTCVEGVVRDLVAKVDSPAFTAFVNRHPVTEFAARD